MNLEFESSDWSELFRLAYYLYPTSVPGGPPGPHLWPGNVARVLAKVDGANFGDSWAIVLQTWDKLYYAVVGTCNATTGNGSDEWRLGDCSVRVTVSRTYDGAVRFGLGESERARMGIVIPERPT